jgi:hypothetical protein
VVTLSTGTVVGRRAAPTLLAAAERVTLPTVTVVGRRAPTAVAVETGTVEHPRAVSGAAAGGPFTFAATAAFGRSLSF